MYNDNDEYAIASNRHDMRIEQFNTSQSVSHKYYE
jgi:hypothetical protein